MREHSSSRIRTATEIASVLVSGVMLTIQVMGLFKQNKTGSAHGID